MLGKGVSLREAKEAQLTLIDLAQNFADSLVLLIWHDFSGSAKGKAVPRFALLDFCNNGELTMTVSRKPLKATAAGDSPVVAAPHFRGDTLRFLDHKNEGTAVYWDGARYLWYPIE